MTVRRRGRTRMMRMISLTAVGVVGLGVIATQPALAQTTGTSFCTTDMAQTLRNIVNLVQWGGPLLGGVIFLGSSALIPMVSSYDQKADLKHMRNQAIIWGVVACSLGTAILTFILGNVVSNGISCTF